MRELPDAQAGFIKGRGTRARIANIRWIIKKASKFQKNIKFQFIVIHTVKGFDIVNKAEVDVFLELSWFFYDLSLVRIKLRRYLNGKDLLA